MRKNSIILSVILICFLFIFTHCNVEPYSQGKILYDRNCSSCHGSNGEGLKNLYPPLAKSDYLNKNQNRLACIIKKGINEPILVNEKPYNELMYGITHLNAVEITNIANYINTNWGNNNPIVKVEIIEQQLKNCKEVN